MAEFEFKKTVSRSISLPGVTLKPGKTGALRARVSKFSEALAASRFTIAEKLKDALDQALSSPVWSLPKGEDQDLVDSGRLKASGSVTATENGITISYSAPYANLIHYGGYILPYGNESAQKVYIPPRPWVQSVVAGGGPVPQFDFAAIIREAVRRALG